MAFCKALAARLLGSPLGAGAVAVRSFSLLRRFFGDYARRMHLVMYDAETAMWYIPTRDSPGGCLSELFYSEKRVSSSF